MGGSLESVGESKKDIYGKIHPEARMTENIQGFLLSHRFLTSVLSLLLLPLSGFSGIPQ